jgi:hypothetical protein
MILFATVGTGCGRWRLPADEELVAFFRAHRADLDSLRINGQAQIRFGPNDRDPGLVQQREEILRRLGLPGAGTLESTNRIFMSAGSRRLGPHLAEWKGFAWIDSVQPKGAMLDTVANLDSLDEQALKSPVRHIRHLEGHWWLYRQVGPPGD